QVVVLKVSLHCRCRGCEGKVKKRLSRMQDCTNGELCSLCLAHHKDHLTIQSKEREREFLLRKVELQKHNEIEKRAAADVASALESYEADNGDGYNAHYLMKSTIMSGCKCIDVQSKTLK
ncbi:unnamed protein product, partial [Brassica napus]